MGPCKEKCYYFIKSFDKLTHMKYNNKHREVDNMKTLFYTCVVLFTLTLIAITRGYIPFTGDVLLSLVCFASPLLIIRLYKEHTNSI